MIVCMRWFSPGQNTIPPRFLRRAPGFFGLAARTGPVFLQKDGGALNKQGKGESEECRP